MDKYRVIIDENNAVLSFPPIINGNHTTVKNSTKDFFIDVTDGILELVNVVFYSFV